MRDQKTSNREAELTAPPRIGSGDLLGHSQRTKYMKIGDKVVCVDDSPCSLCGAPINLIKNQVYVAMGVSDQWPPDLRVSILGRKSKCEHGRELEHWVAARRFRLLDELKEQNANKQQQAQVA